MRESFNQRKINFPFLCRTVLFLLLIAAASADAEVLPIRIFTAADGLGSGYVSYLMKDSRGFLWFCTRDGLTRFDGSRFINYRVSGRRSSPPGIEQIIETRTGVYWITTTGGLYRYDPRKPIENRAANDDRPTLGAEFIGSSRGALYEDAAGNLWLGGDALYRIAEQPDGKISFEKIELNLPTNPKTELIINRVVESRDASLWLITTWGVVRRLADGRQIFYQTDGLRSDTVSSLIEDRAGRIWLARPSKFYILKPETIDEVFRSDALDVRRLDDAIPGTTKSGFAFPETSGALFQYADIEDFAGEGTQKFLYQTSDGHIWLTYGLGAIEFDGAQFVAHTTEQGFIKGGGQIVEDAAGNLWFGWSTGLMRLNRDGLTTYGARDGLKNPAILNIGETTDGAIYAGDGDFYVSRFDGSRLESVRPALPPKARTLWMSKAVFQDSAGEWWFLTNEKLYRFAAGAFNALGSQKPLAEYHTGDGFKSNAMSHIFEDSEKNLWISNRGPNVGQSGLARWSRFDEKFYFFSEADGLPPNKAVTAFAEDAAGNCWFGFYEGGLARFSGNHLTMFSSAETNGVVTALHLDQRGRLWMTSSQNGLSLIENTNADELTFTSYTTENGLTSNNARSMTEDEFGQIYVGTARGVDRFSPATKQIKHYTTSDGLAGDFVNVAYRARDGALWFGTPNGLSRLVPQPETKIIAPPVWLSGLRIAGERQPVSELGAAAIENLELQPEQNNLQIEFFGVDFKTSESLRYQFMLEGADLDWSAPTEQRAVNYANLSAGNYRFLVRAVSADASSASANPSVISFRILRPVWQRWWFLILAALVISFLIYSLYRYRVRQLLKLERVRTRIATDLHDDIGSSLSQIAILSEVVRQKIGGSSNGVNQPLEMIADTSREMVDSMSDIVWAINPDKDYLSDLIQRMRRFASDILDAKDIAYQFDFDEKHRDVSLGADIRREVYLIFKESINNLVKYAEATMVEMSARIENNFLVVRVEDNGKGFVLSEAPVIAGGFVSEKDYDGFGGNGLINMRRRAENLGGRFSIESEMNAGTTVEIKIPI